MRLKDTGGQSTVEFAIVLGMAIMIAAGLVVLSDFVGSGLIEQHAQTSNIHLLNFDHVGFWGYVLLY